LLQAVERLSAKKAQPSLIDKSGSDYVLRFTARLSEHQAKEVFSPSASEGRFYGNWWQVIGQHVVGSEVLLETTKAGGVRVAAVKVATKNSYASSKTNDILEELQKRNNLFPLPFPSDKRFFLAAERDVQPEKQDASNVIRANGTGVTNAIWRVLNNSENDPTLITDHLLTDLNEILHPQFEFTGLITRIHGDQLWEIYLRTKRGRLVPLSQSGSGLKTVLILLSNVHLKIGARDKPIRDGVYVIEELENSLHPRVQRNIYQYLRRKFIDDCVMLISTHSPVAVDFFHADSSAAFFQVSQEEEISKCKKIEAFDDQLGVIDALGVRASDALMSNFVVWVEGPSDRTYINKLIAMSSEGELHEGREYSIMFYGGRLLSHLTVSEDEEVAELIRLLKINPKCAVIMDSDKATLRASINDTKLRIRREALAGSRMVWLTKGREIENYVTADFWAKHFPVAREDVSEYSKVFDAVEAKKAANGQTIRSKVELAAFVDRHARESDFGLDWQERSKELVGHIRNANT
jgi:putative ATP-dependent endonuclease of OLD family